MLLKLNGTKNYRMSVHISVMRADKETSVGKSAIFKARNKKIFDIFTNAYRN